jgi:hypothetical protein
MNDSLSIKPLVAANVTGSVLGTVRAFERATGLNKNRSSRINTALGSQSPTRIEIQHTLPANSKARQQSLMALLQTLNRVDVGGNTISMDTAELRLTLNRAATVTDAELFSMFLTLAGGLLENNGALFLAWCQAQE